jgi:hypothetical protein
MRYTFLIAAAMMLATTSVGLAKTDYHHRRPIRPGYGAVHVGVVPAARSWLEIEHELDPCHCSSSLN